MDASSHVLQKKQCPKREREAWRCLCKRLPLSSTIHLTPSRLQALGLGSRDLHDATESRRHAKLWPRQTSSIHNSPTASPTSTATDRPPVPSSPESKYKDLSAYVAFTEQRVLADLRSLRSAHIF